LTERLTSRSDTQVGHNDPVIRYGTVIAQGIKVTLGITIDPQKKVRLIITYPASTGRNFNEILRVLDSLQLVDSQKIATPVNWQNGDDVIVPPSVSTEEARKIFPKGVTEVKPYLRYTPQPNI